MSNPQVPLPPGWLVAFDPSGKQFYFNTITAQTSWTPPTSSTAAPTQQPTQQVPAPAAAPAAAVQAAPLPPGWEEAFDPRTNRPFYIDHNTKKTSWVRPVPGPAAAAPAPAPTSPAKLPAPQPIQTLSPGPAPSMASSQILPRPQPYAGYGAPVNLSQSAMAPPALASAWPPASSWPYPPQAPAFMPQQVAMATAPVAPVVPEMLCTGKPDWAPAFANQTTCTKCGGQFALFKRKHQCKCCSRDFCDTCLLKRTAISWLPNDPKTIQRVCDACMNHISKNDPRCMPRLVPYFTDTRDGLRLDSLRELGELLNVPGLITGPDMCCVGCVDSLLQTLSSDATTTMLSARSLEIAVGLDPEIAKRVSNMPDISKLLCESTERQMSVVPLPASVSSLLELSAKISETSPVACQKMVASGALRLAHRALESPEAAIQRSAARLVSTIALASKDAPSGDIDEENAVVFALVALLQSSSSSQDLLRNGAVAAALSALSALSVREGNRMSFNQAEGTKTVVGLLESTEEKVRQAAAQLLLTLSKQAECCGAIAESLGPIVTFSANNRSKPEIRELGLSILKNLSSSDATQRSVNQSLLLDHISALMGILSEAAVPITLHGAILEIILSILSTHAEIAGPIIREARLLELLLEIVSARTPLSLLALRAVALSSQGIPESGEILAKADVIGKISVIIGSMGQDPNALPECMNALWALTGLPAVRSLFVSKEPLLGIVIQHLSNPSPVIKAAACGILSNVPELGIKAAQMGAFTPLCQMATSTDADSATHGLRTMTALCNVEDPSFTIINAAMNAKLPAIVSPLLRIPTPALQYHSTALTAALCLCPAARAIMSKELPTLVAMAGSGRDKYIREVAALALSRYSSDEAGLNALRVSRAAPAFAEMLFTEGPGRKTAVKVLSRLADTAAPVEVEELLSLGVIVGLVEIAANSTDEEASCEACISLSSFLRRSEKCRQVAGEGSAKAVAAALQRGGKNTHPAITLLKTLAKTDEFTQEFISCGGVAPLTEAATKGNTLAAEAIVEITNTVSPSLWDHVIEAAGPAGLVALSSSESPDVRALAAGTIATAAEKQQESLSVLISAGAVRAMVPLLKDQDPKTREYAMNACSAMSSDPVGREQLLKAGGLKVISSLHSTSNSKMRAAALSCIWHLMSGSEVSDEDKMGLVDAGAIPPLIEALFTPDSPSLGSALGIAQSISTVPKIAETIYAQGGVDALSSLLSSTDDAVIIPALGTLLSLSSSSVARAAVLTCQAFTKSIGTLLQSQNKAVQEAALQLISSLSADRAFSIQADNAEFLTALANLLKMENPPEAAVKVISATAAFSKSRKAIAAAGCLEPLTALSLAGNSQAIDALASLSYDEDCRKAMSTESLNKILEAIKTASPEDARIVALLRLVSSLSISEELRTKIVSYEGLVENLAALVCGPGEQCGLSLRVLGQLAVQEGAVAELLKAHIADIVALGNNSTISNTELFSAVCDFLTAFPNKACVAEGVARHFEGFAEAIKHYGVDGRAAVSVLQLLKQVVFFDQARACVLQLFSVPEALNVFRSADSMVRLELYSLFRLLGLDI